AFQRAIVLGHAGLAAHFALHRERNIIAVHFTVGDLGRRGFLTAAAETRNAAGELRTILLERDRNRGRRTTAAARLLIGPLAGDIRRKSDDAEGKRNRNNKKQLFGHSAQ